MTETSPKTEAELFDENQKLHYKVEELTSTVEDLTLKLKWYEEQLNLTKLKRFGASSEATGQQTLDLFNEAETEQNSKAAEPEIEKITYERKKRMTDPDSKLKDLPVERIEYTIEDATCPQCHGPLHVMTEEIRKELKVIPAQLVVIEHVRKVYACRHCEANDIKTPILRAKMPNAVIPKSMVSPSLLAFVMNRKYCEAVPLYRQQQQFQNYGIELSRQNLANWMIAGANWLDHLYKRLHTILLTKDILHADETTVQVLNEKNRKAERQSYMWVYLTGRADEPIALYEYQETRSTKHPQAFLSGFKGYLHTDGYAGYQGIKGVKLVGCLAHARRKFDEAIKAAPKGADQTLLASQEGLDFCNQLFKIEREIEDKTFEERKEARTLRSRPLLDRFLSWLNQKSRQVLPKSSFGTAIQYCLNQWPKLVVYLEDGRLDLSNNRAERAIKPFVIGRKNWLFSNTPRGASASATIYSIVETAKQNGLSPYHYLEYLFEQLPNIDVDEQEELDQLLPWSASIPERCKVKTNTPPESSVQD
ncbi:MAG: IS66 family transposase [Candidatus Izemoplasmatales bacterium]|jgi:transposase